MSAEAVPTCEHKVCIVTGGNRGIGKEVVRGFARAGAHVVLVSRSAERGEEAAREIRAGLEEGAAATGTGTIEPMVADLSSQASIREFVAGFRARHARLHVLVNNAAVITPQRTTTVDGLETQFAVNHLAPYLLTRLLLKPLRAAAPSRIITVASQAHRRGKLDFADLQSEDRYHRDGAYAMTKLANVLFTYELNRRLRRSGATAVTANAIHPGVVATGLLETLLGFFAPVAKLMLNPARGAAPIVDLATKPEFQAVSGAYFNRRRQTTSSRASRDEATARRLWEVSATLCGLDPDGPRGVSRQNGGVLP